MAEWSIPFDELAKRANKDIETVVRTAVLIIFERVIMRSPVDTGRFRANWVASFGNPSTETKDAVDRNGAGTVKTMQDAVLSYAVGGLFYLCNSLPYALVLEYGRYPNPPKFGSKKRGETEKTIHVVNGFSKQAPQGMVRLSAREFAYAALKSLNLSIES